MDQISIFKKIKLFSIFKKIVNQNKVELEQTLNIRIDDAFRLYTVLNIPQEFIGEAYDLKKSDIEIMLICKAIQKLFSCFCRVSDSPLLIEYQNFHI